MPKYNIMLAMPGPSFCWGAVRGLAEASAQHAVGADNSGNGFDDMDLLWVTALNRAAAGQITHFAMLHADIAPQAGWLDVLIEECERLDADLVSAVVPLKDPRGITSTGVSLPDNPWGAFRRFAVRELSSLPATFHAADAGYAGFPLLVNSGCWVADLRKPVFTTETAGGQLACDFSFPRRIIRDPQTAAPGPWRLQRESEDWHFSRGLARLGPKVYATRRVQLCHMDGKVPFPNYGTWGTQEHDEETQSLWQSGPMTHLDVEGWFDFADLYRERVQAVHGQPAHFVEVGSWLGKSAAYMAQAIKTSGKPIRFDAVDNWTGGADNGHNQGVGPISATHTAVAGRGVDLFATWQRNLAACGVAEYVRPVRGDSEATADRYHDRALDFVFIDADHSPGRVYRDLAAWLPKLRPGGLLAGHDFDETGPRQGATEFARDRGLSLSARDRCFSIEVPA